MSTIDIIKNTLVIMIIGLMMAPVIDGETITMTSFAGICSAVILGIIQALEAIAEWNIPKPL
ncbi:hypothetical protein CV133_gene23 [Chlorobiaceae phage CV-1-33]|nr:hypothetical protein CV133_gene23 [Chlorobiaceae phage CV-1-33]